MNTFLSPINRLFLALLVAASISSCSKSSDPKPATTLSLARDTASVVQAGAILTVAVSSNTSWGATSDAPWALVTPSVGISNGTLTIVCAPNSTGAGRTAVITVSALGAAGSTFTITQAGLLPALSILKNTLWKPTRYKIFQGTSALVDDDYSQLCSKDDYLRFFQSHLVYYQGAQKCVGGDPDSIISGFRYVDATHYKMLSADFTDTVNVTVTRLTTDSLKNLYTAKPRGSSTLYTFSEEYAKR